VTVPARSRRGRFDAQLGLDDLRDAVCAVARYVRPNRPETVRQREFDDARASAGHPNLVTSRAIVLRLNGDAAVHRSWREWLKILLDKERSLTQTRAAATRAQPLLYAERLAEADEPAGDDAQAAANEELEQHVYFGLRRVATERKVKTLTRDDYAAGREALVAANPSLADDMPTLGQVERFLTWDQALEIAELEPLPALAQRTQATRIRGLSRGQATALFVRHHGAWPTDKVLAAYCRQAGIRFDPNGDRAQARAQAAELLKTDAVPVPDASVRFADADAAFNLPPAGSGPPSRTAHAATEERCVLGLMIWLDTLEPNAKRTRAAYLSFSKGRHDCPAPNRFDQHGGFTKLKRQAERRLAGGERP
jgi:hypothetical protein